MIIDDTFLDELWKQEAQFLTLLKSRYASTPKTLWQWQMQVPLSERWTNFAGANREFGEFVARGGDPKRDDLRVLDLGCGFCMYWPALTQLGFRKFVEIDLFIDTKFDELDRDGEAELPEKRRLVVYRIAEEALNNVLKHAGATSVKVRLFYQEPGLLVFSLVDDGCGFDSSLTSVGQGLAMMSDYAQALGGRTEIIASPGEGTSVRLVLGLDGAESSAVPSLGWNQIEVNSR